MRSPELDSARQRLAEAISEVDRLVLERDGLPERGSDELLTHWVVVYSHSLIGGDPSEDATQVSTLRSDGMSYWMAGGLLASEAQACLVEHTQDDDS